MLRDSAGGRDLERAARFYRDVLGLREVARGTFGAPMAFFSASGANHHDRALLEVGPEAPRPAAQAVGLELYVDADPEVWRTNPATVAAAGPLRL